MPFSKITVGIVDDHKLIRDSVTTSLHISTNIKVVASAQNGKELIACISQLNAPPDIIILDVRMPEMNGFDTLTALKKIHPQIKFLVLSMVDHSYTILQMLQAGANGYLDKNSGIDQLINAVFSIHEHGFFYSEVASKRSFELARAMPLPEFTKREVQFLKHCCSNRSYSAIANEMSLSERTVQDYQKSICKKLNLHTRVEVILFAKETGLV